MSLSVKSCPEHWFLKVKSLELVKINEKIFVFNFIYELKTGILGYFLTEDTVDR